jgi:hypothetical protein
VKQASHLPSIVQNETRLRQSGFAHFLAQMPTFMCETVIVAGMAKRSPVKRAKKQHVPARARVDYERTAAELLRALRGQRSQVAWSRRLGSRGNVAYSWESGRRFPTAARTFWAAERAGIDVAAALARFYRTPAAWLASASLATPEGVARLLMDLRGQVPIGELALRAGRSRFSVSRWISGAAEPRLPDFLRLIEATSLRLLDFVEELVGAARLPSLALAWQELSAARRAAYEVPWSHAVLRALELEQYRDLPAHEPGWIARRIGIEPAMEAECLAMLEQSGQVARAGRHFVVANVRTVDTRQEPEASHRLKLWWAQVGVERLSNKAAGMFSYNLFTVSESDYQRLCELHSNYFRQMRAIIERSEPAERVVLANLQLFGLDAGP